MFVLFFIFSKSQQVRAPIHTLLTKVNQATRFPQLFASFRIKQAGFQAISTSPAYPIGPAYPPFFTPPIISRFHLSTFAVHRSSPALSMKTALRFLVPFCFMLFVAAVSAQPGQTPPADIRPVLRKMTTSQKMELLDFLRTAGASLDKEIQQVYDQLGAEQRSLAVQYIDILNRGVDKIPRTTVSWNRDTIRFGQVEEGSIVIDSFRVTNTGVYPYIVRDVKASCDCTVLQFPKFPVMPGETATVRVEFDSQGKIGRATPGIVVYDNSTPNTRNILYLDGAILPRVKKKDIIKD